MGFEQIILETAHLIAEAGFDGARVSRHTKIPGTQTEKHLDELRKQGVIIGHTSEEESFERAALMMEHLRRSGVADLDDQYCLTISRFPQKLSRWLASRKVGVAGQFDTLVQLR